MNCQDLNRFFENGDGKPLPEAAERHLSACPACRRLQAVLESARSQPSTSSSNPMQPPLVLPVGLLENLEPVRPLSRTPGLILTVIFPAALICAAAVAWWGVAGWRSQTTLERLILFGTVVAALSASAYGLCVEMIPGSKSGFDWRWVEAGAFAAFLLTILIAFHHAYRFNMRAIDGGCFGRGLLTAAAVLLLLLVAIRRGVFLNRLKVSVTIAALISSAALLVLTLYCPILTWSHVIIAHLGAVAVIVAAGITAGQLVE